MKGRGFTGVVPPQPDRKCARRIKVLVLNGSPRKNGTVAKLMRAVIEWLPTGSEIDWIDVNDLHMKPCTACMACRTTDARPKGSEIERARHVRRALDPEF